MVKGIYKQMMAQADAVVTSVDVDTAAGLPDNSDYVLVDIRDIRELKRDGMVSGAFHAPRGMLEFWIDEESPYHKPIFAEERTFIFYCASGWRSLLAAQTAQQMGLKVKSMRGGFSEWKKKGHPVATRDD